MELSLKEQNQIHQYLEQVYTLESEEDLLDFALPELARIVPTDFYSLVLFSNTLVQKLHFSTNNPDEFAHAYTDYLAEEDIFTEALVRSGKQAVSSSQVVTSEVKKSDFFYNECQRIRPADDEAYFSLIVDGMLAGFVAMCRAADFPKPYSAHELSMLSFLISFLPNAFSRVLTPPPPSTDTATVDAWGNVLQAGEEIAEVLLNLLEAGRGDSPWSSPGLNGRRYRKFVQEALFRRPGFGGKFLELRYNGSCRRFVCRPLSAAGIRPYLPHLPQANLSLVGVNSQPFPVAEGVLDQLSLSPREQEVIRLVCRGMSNREIAGDLMISVATVKHHLYNIFNKTGVDSRTQLIFRLSSLKKN
jgi:DNA-binding CsgD family transcriptional regulator